MMAESTAKALCAELSLVPLLSVETQLAEPVVIVRVKRESNRQSKERVKRGRQQGQLLVAVNGGGR